MNIIWSTAAIAAITSFVTSLIVAVAGHRLAPRLEIERELYPGGLGPSELFAMAGIRLDLLGVHIGPRAFLRGGG